MNRWLSFSFWLCLLWLAFPVPSPAPIVYTPGIGWHYEKVGEEGSWRREDAKEQLQVAQAAFDKKDYSTALKAGRRIVTDKRWKYGDYAAQAQYLVGRSYEAKHHDEKAFKAYQNLIETYPKLDNFDEVIKRQFAIANRFLNRQRFKAFGYVPIFPSMDKTIKLYEQIIKNGPYSEVAPLAQMNIGAAHENRKVFSKVPRYADAAKAYEKAADRYSEQKLGVDAMWKQAQAYTKQARRAEYDQSIAGQAIATYTDFMTLHPEEPRVKEALNTIDSLKTEQARGSFDIARFYEKKRRWQGALVYYNEVLLKDPVSKYAVEARQRIDRIKKRGA